VETLRPGGAGDAFHCVRSRLPALISYLNGAKFNAYPTFMSYASSRYFVTLVGLTVAVKEGVLGKTDEERAEAIEKVAVKLEPYIPVVAIDSIRSSPTVGAFAVAWVAAKFTEPVRLVATFFIVPRLARYLSRAPAKKIKDSMKK